MTSSRLRDLVKRPDRALPEIPEEALGADGRPVSLRPSWSQKNVDDGKGKAVYAQETCLSRKIRSSNEAAPKTLLADPATSFGLENSNGLNAVPAVLEYKTSRGRSKVTVREATAQEINGMQNQDVPIISNVTDLSFTSIIPNEDPKTATSVPSAKAGVRVDHERLEHTFPTISIEEVDVQRQSNVDTIRSSTTEIRLSTASSHSDSSTVNEKDVQNVDLRSNASTLLPHMTPAERIAGLSLKPSMDSFSHILPHYASKSSMRSHAHQRSDVSEVSEPATLLGTLGSNQSSRFSWHVSRTDKAGDFFTRWFVDWWALEILSWCFSTACMIIIVIVLLQADGKPLPDWNLGVSVNAFISIFSGFAKSALLLPTAEALGQLKWTWFTKKRRMIDFEVMDSASRGPIGSLMLLMRSKGITLASVGAAIILLSLPLDLFFQQIVAYPEPYLQDMNVDPPQIARSIFYDPSADYLWRDEREIITNDYQIDSILAPYWWSSTMIPMLTCKRTKLDQYPQANISFQCPTSNCTFDPFYTLAFDYQCQELPSDTLRFGCQATSGEWLSSVAYEGPYSSPNITSCGWYLDVPDYVALLMSGYETGDDGVIGEILATRVFPLTDVYTKQRWFDGSLSFKNISNPIVDFVVVSTPGGFEGALRNATPVAHECEVHWAVREVVTYISHGIPRERSISTRSFASDVDDPWSPVDSNSYQANFSMTLPDTHALHGNTSTFGLTNETAVKVWQSWAEFAPSAFVRPVRTGSGGPDRLLKMSWLSGSPAVNAAISSDVLPWDHPNNVSAHMAQAVFAMNTVMRNNVLSATNRKDAAYGRAYRYVTVVNVRWVWISLPAMLLVFAGVFLVVTIMRARKDSSIGIWKTSALAVLFNGPGEDVQQFVGEGKRAGHVRRKARDMEVQLGND